jgi:hypothetical protein
MTVLANVTLARRTGADTQPPRPLLRQHVSDHEQEPAAEKERFFHRQQATKMSIGTLRLADDAGRITIQ